MSSDFSAHLRLAASMAIVGGSVVAGKVVADGLPLHLASAVRMALAAGALLPLTWKADGGLRLPSKRDLTALGLCAFTGVFLFNLFLLWGLRLTGAAEAGVITATTPAVLAVVALIMLGERPGKAGWLAIALSAAGLLVLQGRPDGFSGSLAGTVLVLAAVVCEALFTVYGQRVSGSLSPLATSFWVNALALAMFVPGAAIEAVGFDWTAVTLGGWLAILYGGLGASALAYVLWYAGLARLGAAKAAPHTAMMPLAALALSALLLGEEVGLRHLVGMALVGAALAVNVLPRPAEFADRS